MVNVRIFLYACSPEMVLGGNNSQHREPFGSFVNEYLQTGKNIMEVSARGVTSFQTRIFVTLIQ